jgi:putative flavoprotein involved in K+ transport
MITSLPPRIENLVIGAGQAGLAMSWHLQRAGREHVVLERRSTLGGGWQDRWDGFRLVTPNWSASFPDAPYDGDEPDGYMRRDELVARISRYADTIAAPVMLDAGVERMVPKGDAWQVDTTQGYVVADKVIVATGGFAVPRVPPVSDELPRGVLQLHAHDYRREADLPPGAVLVVGSGQTGVQLTEELLEAGREVYLCVGSAGRVPRRYRGRDIFHWLAHVVEDGPSFGTVLPTAPQLPDPRMRFAGNPQLSGHGGGHEPDLRAMARDGAVLLGRLKGVDGSRCYLGDDLMRDLDAADRFFDERFRELIDAYIEAAGVDAPPPEPRPHADYEPVPHDMVDLDAAGISTVLWTCGYRPDYSWIDAPVTDELGLPVQDRGVTEIPGLFFIGSLWQYDLASATLVGLRRDARMLAERMGLRLN